MSNENKTGLVGIQGNKVVEIAQKPKEPQERLYSFTVRTSGTELTSFSAHGVLVVTPGFVGVGDKDGTEIRAVVPLDNLVYVTEAQMGASQGSA